MDNCQPTCNTSCYNTCNTMCQSSETRCCYEQYENECESECEKYKGKADELYVRAQCVQEDAKRASCEAKQLEIQARDLEKQVKLLLSQARIAWDKTCKLEAEVENLLNLSNFYACKATECYKSANVNSLCKPDCNCKCTHKYC